jgi:tRNA threonylcarbamoyladenosine biosynthesis protein TsaE
VLRYGGLRLVSRSEEETRILGASLSPVLLPGDVVSLSGDLGAGKTTLVQGIAAGLGVEGPVTSPSFVIVHHLEGTYPIIHMDVYRLNLIQEVLDLGFEELLEPQAIMLVEWGEAVLPLLPRRYLDIELRHAPEGDDDLRLIVLRPVGFEWARKLEHVRVTADALLDAASPESSSGSRFVYERAPDARDDKDVGKRPDWEK